MFPSRRWGKRAGKHYARFLLIITPFSVAKGGRKEGRKRERDMNKEGRIVVVVVVVIVVVIVRGGGEGDEGSAVFSKGHTATFLMGRKMRRKKSRRRSRKRKKERRSRIRGVLVTVYYDNFNRMRGSGDGEGMGREWGGTSW